MPIEYDVLIIELEANRIKQLAQQRFNRHFDKHNGNSLFCNLYARIGKSAEDIIDNCNELYTCLELIEEQEEVKVRP